MSDVCASFAAEHLPPDSAESDVIAKEATHAVVTAGSLLKQAREAAGLHIAALAVALKVPVKKLEALEADRFDLLPDVVFARALASSVCRNLRIDAVPVLERLPQTSSPKLAYAGRGVNTPFRAPRNGPGPSVWAQVSRPAVLAGLVLLLGALVLVMLPAVKTGLSASGPETAPTAPNTQPFLPAATESVVEAVTAGAATPRASVFPVALSSPDVGSSGSGSPSIAASSSPFPAPATLQALAVAVSPASAGPSGTSTGVVVFSAKGASWVEVTDSKGVVVLRRTLSAGEVVGASGALPLAAIVGRADATQVQVRGQAFDLTAATKDNVARFEVK